ncbi:HAD-IC family P-type ATPase [Candidatus Gottesmanbacteria bacterium]|nr:HAD-IC family P-type ATPase [Candidatus Gottesmanbacteria bacterium]
MSYQPYTTKSTEEILENFHVQAVTGLGIEEIDKIRSISGWNEVEEKSLNAVGIFIRQFKSPFIYLLLSAGFLSYLLGEPIDAVMIYFFVAINTFLGFYQEYRSEQAVKYLKNYIISKATVIRGGRKKRIASRELVPGDIVLLESGDLIPADVRFIEVENLIVNESVLTGESLAVSKTHTKLPTSVHAVHKATNIGFSGTTIESGIGRGIVIATGMMSEMGMIAAFTSEARRVSEFEKNLSAFSLFILRIILITLMIVFLGNLFIKGPNARIGTLVVFSIALAVSVIPEALPVVTTFSLSRGAVRLAQQKMVVKRLSAIEDLGSIQVLCSDKTGTLTQNELTTASIYSWDESRVLEYAALASSDSLEKLPNNAFDRAIGKKLSSESRRDLARYKKIAEIPFDPYRKINSVFLKHRDSAFIIIRGAPEKILEACEHLSRKERAETIRWFKTEGSNGRRVLALATKSVRKTRSSYSFQDESRDFLFQGMISFHDPVKESAHMAIDKAQRMGVDVKILTGDNEEIAGVVAKYVGIIDSVDEVISGEEFDQATLSRQHELVKKYHVFARASPTQKYKIIEILKESYAVGFLGEGINDAPALKIADVGMVVNDASDVAREAADIVLMKKSLRVIVDGIEEGRKVFANTIKYIKATLASNFGNFYAVALASLLVDFLPMLPLQILLVNLLSDFPMIAIATDTVDTGELRSPKTYDIREIAIISTLLGLVSSVFDFIFFGIFVKMPVKILQTNWFIASIMTELAFLFSIRTHGWFFKAKGPSLALLVLSCVALLVTVILPFTSIGQTVFGFYPPRKTELFMIISLVGAYFVVTEGVKFMFYRNIQRESEYNHSQP